jgi:hypothetical protein
MGMMVARNGLNWVRMGWARHGQVRTGWVKQDGNGSSMHMARAGLVWMISAGLGKMGWDGMGWDGMGCDGIGKHGMGWAE